MRHYILKMLSTLPLNDNPLLWAGVGSVATAFAVIYLTDTIKLLDKGRNIMVESSPSLN